MTKIPKDYEKAVNELAQEVERFLQFTSPYPYTALTLALNNLRITQMAIESATNSELEQLQKQIEEQIMQENANIIKFLGKKS